jgi:hypothetical protein
VKQILPLIFVLAFTSVLSQPYGNEWITYSQRYYKIPIAEDGVYRITFNDLANIGIPVSSINPQYIQMYAHGEALPIYISGETDGVFNVGDYIDFIGRKNDGRKEAVLFPSATAHANSDYSLYNDTLYHFITWGNQGGNARIQVDNDLNFDPFQPVPYLWKESRLLFVNDYYQGELDAFGVSAPFYTEAEGWMSGRFGFPGGSLSLTANVPTPMAYLEADAPQASVQSVSAGASNANTGGASNHHLQIKYGSANALAVNHQFSGYKLNRFTFSIPASALGTTTTSIRHEVINSLGAPSDYQAVAKIALRYAHLTDLGGQAAFNFLYQLNTSQNKTRFDLSGISGSNPIIYTASTNPRRVVMNANGANWRALLPNSFSEDEYACWMVTDQSIKAIPAIKIAANNGFFTNFGQTQVDSAYLIVAHQSLLASAQAYANYRQQRFNTVLADVDELYDQFGFGVNKSGLALRNYCDYLLNTWSAPPQYLLLLGKSVREAREGNTQGGRQNTTFFSRNLVPSLGYPSSDNYITAGLANTTLEPAIRTGRLSAKDAIEVDWYLQKVQAFEAQPHAEWMKNVLHFGGGANLNEQQNFASYLQQYGSIIQDSSFAGVTHTFLKNSSAPIQINVSQDITNLIENGTSLLTFFGHATSDGFDQSIDNPANFDWNGRYPLLLGNSCFTGDFHSPGYGSTSERFTIMNAKGTIGFIASVKLGFEPYLNIYSRKFYEHLSVLNYGNSIGDHIKRTISDIQFSLGGNPNLFMVNTCLGQSLQGDPAIVLNSWPFPDLSIQESDIYFTPENITAEIDSFSINIVVNNLARGTNQPFTLLVEHETPDGAPNGLYTRNFEGLLYKDTVVIKLPIDPQNGLGLHRFNVSIDLPEDVVEEMPGFEVVNNEVNGVELLISNGGIVPIYPYEYAVVGETGITLRASTGNPLAPTSTYRMEIDTTDTYNSPWLQSTEVSQVGGIVEWTPPLNYPDSMVYFWRARDNNDTEGNWRESSFQYIANQSGWGQSHIFQFKNNNFVQTEFNRDQRQIDFFTGTVRISNRVMGKNQGNPNANEVVLNASIVEYGACFLTPSIHLVIFEPISFDAWGTNAEGQNPDNNFGNANAGTGCRSRVEYHFVFRQNNPTQMQALADLLLGDIIPDGHYVVLFPIITVNYNDWDNTPDIYTAFESLGAQQIGDPDALNDVPYSLICRKGDPDFVFEKYGIMPTDTIINVVDIPANGKEGLLRSRRIGPSQDWESASWRTTSLDTQAGDTTLIRLFGVKPNGIETALFNGEFNPVETIMTDLGNLIDAAEYPYLRLEAKLRDFENATPAQVDRWHVSYTQVPEAAVAPNLHFVFENEQLQQGQTGLLSVAIKNISQMDMDSLLVNYWIEDAERNVIPIDYPRQGPLLAGTTLVDTVTFNTEGLVGSNAIWVEVNPVDRSNGIADQPEQSFFNNLLRVPFNVSADETNPILDVTFDGIHIINGEVVSPMPEILVALKDENPFLLMDQPADTAFFKLFMAKPGGEFEQVFFSANASDYFIDFIPAMDARNQAKILFRPTLPNDGKHKLLIQASDKSGNASGIIDYRIDFEVINRATITEVLNYPNPFTTSTQFVFTLTGTQIPDEFKIQIITVSGKIVREITQAEFGPIRIGRNQSVYRWDGRDEYGDRLANGVYLYRVFARANGEEIEFRDGGAGQFFTRGYGKMFLMR